MNIINLLFTSLIAVVLGFSILLVWSLVVALTHNIIIKTIEKRRSLMLDMLEEEVISLNNTQAGKFGASDVVTNINRRVKIEHFTTIDLQHMAETTIKSLKLKEII